MLAIGNDERRRVLVLGGYGAFGGHACKRLARAAIEVVVAGRSLARAQGFAASLAEAGATTTPLFMDAAAVGPSELAHARAAVVINASGPYQRHDYRLARACIAAGAHYIDLADARAFVGGIAELDAVAKRAGVLVVSGASTLPALSCAVVDAYAPRLAALEKATIIVAPGNSFDPGLATTQSVFGALGRPYPALYRGSCVTRHGWQGLRRFSVPGLGRRWLGRCEVPDLDLLPRRYPGLGTVEVYAALEIAAFHLGLWGTSWLARAGLLRRPERLAGPLLRLKRALSGLGSDVGGLAVALEGKGADGTPRRIDWRLTARRGCGPYIPATPAVLIAKRLLAGRLAARGAMPCVGLMTLDDVLAELADLDVTAGLL
jgi:Saccharopine dehydrogenase NADP binding domain